MKKNILPFLTFTFCFTFLNYTMASSQHQKDSIHQSLNRYYDSLFEADLKDNPEFAATLGKKINYGKWNDRSEEKQKRDIASALASVKYIKSNYDVASFEGDTKLNFLLFEEQSKKLQKDYAWRFYYYIINQLGGDHVDLPNFLINVHQIDTEQDALDYISRLEGMGKVFEENILFLSKQIKLKIYPPKFTFKYVINDIEEILSGFSKKDSSNILYTDFVNKISKINLSEATKKSLEERVYGILNNDLKRAYTNLLNKVLEMDKLAIKNNGVWDLPNGEAFYNHSIEHTTTTNLSPDSIYNKGLSEVQRLHDELSVIKKKMKYKKSLHNFFTYLKTNKKFSYPNNDSGRNLLLSRSKKYIDNIYPLLGNYFNTLPIAKCIVLPVEKFREKSSSGAFYEQPSEDGKRPGRFYVNLYNMDSEKTYDLEALVYHEALPGHHMQIAISQELKNIPQFRKYAFNNAYVEGWALYSEYLANEMNLYKNLESQIGRLSMELFRASRLVLDVGIHYKKWTKKAATNYMIKNTLTSILECQKEVERYFLWPAQATSYKIGMLKILELRAKAKKQLGTAFDIKEFHDIILKNGAVSMLVLETLIDNWIHQKQ